MVPVHHVYTSRRLVCAQILWWAALCVWALKSKLESSSCTLQVAVPAPTNVDVSMHVIMRHIALLEAC